jgi:hypothetical protein
MASQDWLASMLTHLEGVTCHFVRIDSWQSGDIEQGLCCCYRLDNPGLWVVSEPQRIPKGSMYQRRESWFSHWAMSLCSDTFDRSWRGSSLACSCRTDNERGVGPKRRPLIGGVMRGSSNYVRVFTATIVDDNQALTTRQ